MTSNVSMKLNSLIVMTQQSLPNKMKRKKRKKKRLSPRVSKSTIRQKYLIIMVIYLKTWIRSRCWRMIVMVMTMITSTSLKKRSRLKLIKLLLASKTLTKIAISLILTSFRRLYPFNQ